MVLRYTARTDTGHTLDVLGREKVGICNRFHPGRSESCAGAISHDNESHSTTPSMRTLLKSCPSGAAMIETGQPRRARGLPIPPRLPVLGNLHRSQWRAHRLVGEAEGYPQIEQRPGPLHAPRKRTAAEQPGHACIRCNSRGQSALDHQLNRTLTSRQSKQNRCGVEARRKQTHTRLINAFAHNVRNRSVLRRSQLIGYFPGQWFYRRQLPYNGNGQRIKAPKRSRQ